MTITASIQINAKPLNSAQQSPESTQKIAENATTILKKVEFLRGFNVSTQIQDQDEIQITFEWDDTEDYQTSPAFKSLRKNLHDVVGTPHHAQHFSLNRPAFGPDGPATAPVVEFVQISFPVSSLTPDFKKKIVDDLLKFDELCAPILIGGGALTYGWTLEDKEHEEIKGELSRSLIVVRGWETMAQFEACTKTEEFGKAIPILMAWKAPSKMWHLNKKAADGLQSSAG